jgi:predicted Zn finger-like uncharacterized protein
MSLAARCPSCGTVFRVVQDQLRVSEGWVRCGRCAEVFNAIENLVDLEADVASLPSTRSPGKDRVLEDLTRVSQFHDVDVGEEVAAPQLQPPRFEAEPPLDVEPGALPAPTAPPTGLVAEPDWHAEPVVSPTFVRRAERAARWRRPGVRAGLTALVAAGIALLAAQAGFAYRDLLAARWPASRPWLEQACTVAGCRIEAPKAIESLAVESSGLVRIENTAMYKLSVVLRNRAGLALALPSIDLTLTDSQGGVIARRVIGVGELDTRQSSVPAFAELPLQTTLSAGERTVSGYTIEIFYP